MLPVIALEALPWMPSIISTEPLVGFPSESPPAIYSGTPAEILSGISKKFSLVCLEEFLQRFLLKLFQKFLKVFIQESLQKYFVGSVRILVKTLPQTFVGIYTKIHPGIPGFSWDFFFQKVNIFNLSNVYCIQNTK